MHARELTQRLKSEAERLGFTLSGCCRATNPPDIELFQQWLDAGYAGQMNYMTHRAKAYEHPEHVLTGAKSILMLAVNYRTETARTCSTGQGRVSTYAWGSQDYHDLLHDKLQRLVQYLQQLVPDARARGVVDTAPLLERDFARLAGLGWVGKNTLLLNQQFGSQFFLAALLTDVLLDYDPPFQTNHCGTCRACLDACPTNAFPQPYVLDARRCISYLTIELRDVVPEELRERVGNWIFGCDICQDVCPWNHHVPPTQEPEFQPDDRMNPVDLTALFQLDDDAFRRMFRHTPLWRSRRRGILRNAAIVLGNQRYHEGRDALLQGLGDLDPLVRSTSAWALGKLGDNESIRGLKQQLKREQDEEVTREIHTALQMN